MTLETGLPNHYSMPTWTWSLSIGVRIRIHGDGSNVFAQNPAGIVSNEWVDMVDIEEVVHDDGDVVMMEEPDDMLASQERLLDAECIDKAAEGIDRPTARLHLVALAKKLRREAEALQRMEKVRLSPKKDDKKDESMDENTAPVTKPNVPPSAPVPIALGAHPAVAASPGAKYISVDRFSFDAGGYNAPFVTLYVPMPDVGSIPRENITCDFTKSTFDLVVNDLKGKSYRLFKDSLEKDIDPEKSKIVVKSDKIVVKLHKVKQSYGSYDYWSKLTDAKGRKKISEDPQKSIMQMMKDMYDDGDDNMRKMIGETMMKQQRGELGKDGGMGMGMDGLGDF